MRINPLWLLCVACTVISFATPAAADPTYWNVFNNEDSSVGSASLITYGTLADMLNDTNRTGTFVPGGPGANIVGSGSDGTTYWNVFNLEGTSAGNANIVTYGTLMDMLTDTNRVATFVGLSGDIVGSGSDGTTYWNVFNTEGTSVGSASLVTYGLLADMLNDTNRTGTFVPGGPGANIVGSGSDGTSYWNVFNLEGTSAGNANFVRYGTLTDMLNDTNRLQTTVGLSGDIVGSGAGDTPVPEPSSLALSVLAISGLLVLRRRKR